MGDPDLIRTFEKDLEYWQKAIDDETAKLPNADDSNGTPTRYSDRELILKRIDYYRRQVTYLKRKIKEIKDADRIVGADRTQTAEAIRASENAKNTAVATTPAGSAIARAGDDSPTDHGNSAEATSKGHAAAAAAGGDDVGAPSSATPATGKPK